MAKRTSLRIADIRNEKHRFWGLEAACGRKVRVGHVVVWSRWEDTLFIEHSDCIRDHLTRRGRRGLRQPSYENRGWFCAQCGVSTSWDKMKTSWWKPDGGTGWNTFNIHTECLEGVAKGLAPCRIPISQRHIDFEISRMKALAS